MVDSCRAGCLPFATWRASCECEVDAGMARLDSGLRVGTTMSLDQIVWRLKMGSQGGLTWPLYRHGIKGSGLESWYSCVTQPVRVELGRGILYLAGRKQVSPLRDPFDGWQNRI